MSQSFYSSINFELRMGNTKLVDPIVINLDGSFPMLDSDRFEFDIDMDGTSDLVPYLIGNSGFLAMDKNHDGIINNGSELFGPSTGNGFLELSYYDSDGNNWIDENDPVFSSLRIWLKSGDRDILVALGEVGIGAIYLGNVFSLINYRDYTGDIIGIAKNTGIVLKEEGQPLIIQHIDMRV